MKIQLVAVGARPWDYLVGHWGIALLVDDSVLFDTFASFNALRRKLGQMHASVEQIDTVVISHDHWDHIGGLWELLGLRQGLNVYLPPGSDQSLRDRVREAGSNPVDAVGRHTIRPGIHISDEMLGAFRQGSVAEQSLVLETPAGLIIIAGCAHPGIAGIVRNAAEQFGQPVYGVVGGFHLMHSGMDAVRQCAEELKQAGVTMVAPTHCTGWRAERALQAVFGENFVRLREGQQVPVPVFPDLA